MIRTLVLLFLFTAPALGLFEANLRVTYNMNPLSYGRTSFMEMPKTNDTASTKGWMKMERPEGPSGLKSLVMWCPSDDCTICLLYDDTGYVAGLQIALEQSKFSNAIYDWAVQGFTNWTATCNNVSKTYYTIQQYYVSADTLSIDPATRIAARNSSILLQNGYLWLAGLNGKIYNISTDASQFAGSDSIYTKQGCFPWMGHHYYYNMTMTTDCSAEALFPWFLLKYSDQLVGVGFAAFGTYKVDTNSTNYFEIPDEGITRTNVPHGPECMYELANTPGMITMHTYFIDNPLLISCILE